MTKDSSISNNSVFLELSQSSLKIQLSKSKIKKPSLKSLKQTKIELSTSRLLEFVSTSQIVCLKRVNLMQKKKRKQKPLFWKRSNRLDF